MKSFKSAVIVFLSLGSSAFAGGSGSPVLTYFATNGSVSPQYQTTVRCQISGNDVLKEITGGIVGHAKIRRLVSWTANVPHSPAVLALLQASSDKALLVPYSQPMPMGAGVVDFEGSYLTSVDQMVEVVLDRNFREKNISAAAKTLVEFIQYNCVRQ